MAKGDVVPTRPVIDVTGATAALAVGPNEVLVVTFPAEYAEHGEDALDIVRRRFAEVFPPNRFLIIFADGVDMSKVDSPETAEPGRPYVRPSIETGPQCPFCQSGTAVQVVEPAGMKYCTRCGASDTGNGWKHAPEVEPEELPTPKRVRKPGDPVPKDKSDGKPEA